MRGETGSSFCRPGTASVFQSTPLMRGETRLCSLPQQSLVHFNPLPSCEGRLIAGSAMMRTRRFQSTPLMRGETRLTRGRGWRILISIHSPHARGDKCNGKLHAKSDDFNPLPSCEGRHLTMIDSTSRRIFQSTPLMRGETCANIARIKSHVFQSTPLMRGETVWLCCLPLLQTYFNPLPSCEGRQHKPLKIRLDSRQFIQQNHHSSFF